MALIDVYTASQDADFQGRCLAAAWTTAQHVLAGDTGYNTSSQSENFSLKLLRKQATISAEQVAMQVLRNATIASNIDQSTDNDILFQVNLIWVDLMDIG